MKPRFTRATRDLAEIAAYLRTRDPSAALAVRDAILRSLRRETLFPRSVVPKGVEGIGSRGDRRPHDSAPPGGSENIGMSKFQEERRLKMY